MNRPKSVFDGWTKKIEGRAWDGHGGYCAGGWLRHNNLCDYNWTGPVMTRIGTWIQQNLNPPEVWNHSLYPARCSTTAVVWANNEMKLDIEGFIMADLLSSGYVPEEEASEEKPIEVALVV